MDALTQERWSPAQQQFVPWRKKEPPVGMELFWPEDGSSPLNADGWHILNWMKDECHINEMCPDPDRWNFYGKSSLGRLLCVLLAMRFEHVRLIY